MVLMMREAFDQAAFNEFIDAEGLRRGEITNRNAAGSDWWVKFDLKVEQEFAGFTPDHKAKAFFVIKNVGNLINDDWGVLKQGNSLQPVVTASITDDGKYSFNSFSEPTGQSRSRNASLWEMRLGVQYSF